MYSPAHYRESRPELAYELMARFDFATVITAPGPVPTISHLPLMHLREDSGHGVLIGHMARGNPQWKDFSRAQATAIFHGPHAYISPAWYEPKPDNVPTWNYAVVHAVGRGEAITDATECERLMSEMTRHFERLNGTGWVLPDLKEKSLAALMKAIVIFRIEIETLETKLKLSQNHPAPNRNTVMTELEKLGGENQRGVAEWMRKTAPAHSKK